MSYCLSRYRTRRRPTIEVKVGGVGVGGSHPLRVQSMTTSDTQDVAATVRQSIALAEAGCEIVRITAPSVPAARCLRQIRREYTEAGFGSIPLVADIHFLPSAAMEAVEHVEKVRINPGNYADRKKFAVREYSDADYERELQRLHEAFSPLVVRSRELGRSLRIGTNHGSLSDRIMNRYGDTPLGMVESALEFLRIAESHRFDQIILSMKASNPKVMIEAYRLLVERMDREDMHYPLHLGVTEAGDGEDGRIKGAIGIGSLLLDGLGDTIRVSLTEDSVYEIPVARAIADKAMSLWQDPSADLTRPEVASRLEFDSVDPYHFTRRDTAPVTLGAASRISPEHPPRVVVRVAPEELTRENSPLRHPSLADTPLEGLLLAAGTEAGLAAAVAKLPGAALLHPQAFFILELADQADPAALGSALAPVAGLKSRLVLLRRFAGTERAALAAWLEFVRAHGHYLACDLDAAALAEVAVDLRATGSDVAGRITVARRSTATSPGGCALPQDSVLLDGGNLIFTCSRTRAAAPAHALGAYRALVEALKRRGLRSPVWIRNTEGTAVQAGESFLSRLLEASFLSGGLLGDGLGDLVSIETEADPLRSLRLAYNVLQGAGARISKTEFVACPSCGRTLFDLQTTTQRIREQTGHLKGVKIAIMGCIVNGPGEMADADFGYVGGAPGKINLYVGKQCVQYHIPQAEADARLIALIKEHGKWAEPESYSERHAASPVRNEAVTPPPASQAVSRAM